MPVHIHHRMRFLTALVLVAGSVLLTLVPNPRTVVRAAVSATPALVQTIHTSRWRPASPDPSGITYWPRSDHRTLVLVDGEVEEMAIWAGANMFESTLSGSLVKTYDTTSFNKEPVGIDIEIGDNDHFFISNDSQKTIFDIDLGSDGAFGTSDDKRRPFLTSGFGNTDPEGLTLGAGKLYTVDGAGTEVYITAPGSNGIFEASDPTTHFDAAVIGIADPEGIDYDPATGNLWIVDRSRKRLNEVTTSGTLVQTIDLKALVGAVNPGDVTLAPGSNNAAEQHLYVVDRGIDNNVDPNENDGKIYEITLSGSPPPPPAGNLLVNSSFDLDANGDGRPDTWSSNSKFTRSNAVTRCTTTSHVGRFFATDNSGVTITQKVGVTAGVAYNFAGCVRIPAQNDGTFTFKLQVQWKNSSNSTISTTTIKSYASTTTNDQWQTVTKNGTVAPAGAVAAVVKLVASSVNGNIYVDDFVFGI
jgi:hypothetical protein